MNTLEAYYDYLSQYELPVEAILSPISEEQPGGENLTGSRLYHAIREARRADDATLPQGAWQYELKQADWQEVIELTCDGLVNQSKDLQLMVWMLEALVQRWGMEVFPAGITLLRLFCEQFWSVMQPQVVDEDIEHRCNILCWLEQQWTLWLRLMPLSEGEDQLNWTLWEQVSRNEQYELQRKGNVETKNREHWLQVLAVTSVEFYEQLSEQLLLAQQCLMDLQYSLHALMPSTETLFTALQAQLKALHTFTQAELQRRGQFNTVPAVSHAQQSLSLAGLPINDRNEAYAYITQIADFLQMTDIHSPVPYLLKKAVEWGTLDTVSLYQELFITRQGQINIFEMLGIKPDHIANSRS
ncbi:type VI secretion system protein TssA [Zooshikella sp. RANM57]|uniref:type VI secretion system protein TssA n=1 Tax=Zooshikella sp. RANM57 TaxID=3425863 RepID=UPI003D6E27DC